MKINQNIIIVVLLLLVSAGSFFAGTKYQQRKSPRGNMTFIGTGGNRNGFRPVSGEIIARDDKSITIKLSDGSSKIILLSDTTTVNKASIGAKEDLQTSVKVAVMGTENPDGSISASNIQINPVFNSQGTKAPNTATKSADAREIVVEGGNFKFSPTTISVKKGEKIRILFKNTEGFHDFKIDELGVATAVIQSNQEDFVEFTPDKTGAFKFYCSVGNHRAMGMEGTITVE